MLFLTRNMLKLFAQDAGSSTAGGNDATISDAGGSTTASVDSATRETVYGVQTDDRDATSNTPEANEGTLEGGDTADEDDETNRRRAYNSARREFKDLFDRDTQKIINRRFRETKELEEKTRRQEKVLDYLYARYGVNDLDALEEKVTGDDTLLTRDGDLMLSDEESAQMKRLRVQNAQMSRMLAQSAEAEKARRFNERLAREEAEFKERFPDFSLMDEIQSDPNFARLLRSGIGVKDAYYAIHHEELARTALELAQADAVRKTAENVRARGSRPRENGVGAFPGVVVKSDASKLTRQDREEIAKRALRGDKIKF